MSARQTKPTNVVSLAEHRKKRELVAALEPGLVEKARLISCLATAWSVDLRPAVAIQRGEIGAETPGA